MVDATRKMNEVGDCYQQVANLPLRYIETSRATTRQRLIAKAALVPCWNHNLPPVLSCVKAPVP